MCEWASLLTLLSSESCRVNADNTGAINASVRAKCGTAGQIASSGPRRLEILAGLRAAVAALRTLAPGVYRSKNGGHTVVATQAWRGFLRDGNQCG